MKIVYSEKHAGHDPQTFYMRGTKLPRSSEQPERATRLLAAATAAGHHVVAPGTYGEAPAATIHTPEYLDFLKIAAHEWAKLPGDRKSTRLNSSHVSESRMPSSA